MKFELRRLLGCTVAAALLAVAGLSHGQPATPVPATQTLVVAVDDSLAVALVDVARAFEAARPGVTVRLVPGSSGALLEQMARELQADVLVGSDARTVAFGVRRGMLVDDLRSAFASNTLVLVTPTRLNLPLRRMTDLGRAEVVRIATGREANVPVGRYAREAINAQRLWPTVQRKLVMTNSETEIVALLASAEVEAGFVYATSAARQPEVLRVVEVLATNTPIRYQANVVAASTQPGLGREFIGFLRSEAAGALLQKQGFGPP